VVLLLLLRPLVAVLQLLLGQLLAHALVWLCPGQQLQGPAVAAVAAVAVCALHH
jgi:hypothetical protein